MKYDIESIEKRKEKVKKARRIINIILVVLIYNIMLLTISCMNKIETISIFGCKAYIIRTTSMEPELNIGDVIIVQKIKEEKLEVEDIITFKKENKTITHRIVEIIENDGKKEYITKGDNNNTEDSTKVVFDDIQGRKIIAVPYLGKFIMFLENRIIFLIMILMILILSYYKIIMQEKLENRREKKKIEDEKRAQDKIC